jgi:glycosyltransferase involved in cell wall biosynthesis
MRLCVISPGVVHAVPRTLAIAPHFQEVHYIDTVGRGDTAPLVANGVVCHSPSPGQRHLGTRDIRRLLEKLAPNAIVCHYASGDHFFAAIAHGQCRVAVIAMGSDVQYDNGDLRIPPLARLMIRLALRRAAFISAKSRALADLLRSYGVRCPISVNYWGADLDRFSPGSSEEARRTLGLPTNAPIVLSPRALQPLYNIDRIVEAFHEARKQRPDAQLVIIGRATSEYLQRIERMLKQLKLRDCTHVIGEVDQNILPHYYRAADVVVSLARSEGFPNTLLEAMGCKVPIVIGRIPQIGELLEHGRNAWVCEIESDSVAAAIKEVFDNPEKRERIVEAAYRTAHEHADIHRNGLAFARELTRVIPECSPHTSRSHALRALYLLYRVQRKFT